MIKSNCQYRFTATTEGLVVSVSGEIDHHSALSMRRDVDRLCHVAEAAEIERNGFNLNIPRYVDRYEEPEVPAVAELFQELNDIEGQIADTKRSLLDQFRLLVGTTDESRQELAALMPQAIRYLEDEKGQLSWDI